MNRNSGVQPYTIRLNGIAQRGLFDQMCRDLISDLPSYFARLGATYVPSKTLDFKTPRVALVPHQRQWVKISRHTFQASISQKI